MGAAFFDNEATMKIEFGTNSLTLTREPGDPKFYGVRNGAGESALLHYLKKALNAAGNDVVKRRMWKDGHMVDEMQQYLRTRSPKSPGAHVMIWNGSWALHGANEEWNAGQVTLEVEYPWATEQKSFIDTLMQNFPPQPAPVALAA
jgi:hypothetical protein